MKRPCNENEFVYNGKVFKAVDSTHYCEGCAFRTPGGISAVYCNELKRGKFIPYCLPNKRSDGKDVIFVEVKEGGAQ